MTKRAVLLHGTDGSPTELPWLVWLKAQLETSGYEAYFPQLPECHTPNLALYDAFLQDSGWDFKDNLLIGHSSGATAALHLLTQDWFPAVRATIFVGVFLNEKLMESADWYEPGQFDNLFVDTFDPAIVRKKSDAFYFVHGSDDPYCDYTDAQNLCKQLDGTFLTIQNGGHIAGSSGITELPILVEKLRDDGVV